MSDTDTEGCGQWLTARDNRTFKKPASQRRSKKIKAAEKILSGAVNGISKSSFGGLDVKWSWNPHTSQTKENKRKTKQTKMDRFLKPLRTEQHAAILNDDIESLENTTKSQGPPTHLKRHRQPDASLGEHDDNDDALFTWESRGTEMTTFAPYTGNSDGDSEFKENILHDSSNYSSGFLSGPVAKRLKSFDGNKTEKTETNVEVEGKTVLDQDGSQVFQYTQWAKQQLQECQDLQEIYTSDTLPSLQQPAHEHDVTLEENIIAEDVAEKLTSTFKETIKDTLSQEVQQRPGMRACNRSGRTAKQPSHKDFTMNEHILTERRSAEKSTQGLETEPTTFSERGQKSPISVAQITKYYTDQCTQSGSESQFHFSEWVRNQISDCERLQWDTNSDVSLQEL